MLPPPNPSRRNAPAAAISIGSMGLASPAPRTSPREFGDPVFVERGMFAGRWMRFSLHVAQQPILGRRKTEKDRRPLAHSPIVRLRVRECHRLPSTLDDRERDQWEEEEVDVSSLESSYLICSAELRSPGDAPFDPSGSAMSTPMSRPMWVVEHDDGRPGSESTSSGSHGIGGINTSYSPSPQDPSRTRRRSDRSDELSESSEEDVGRTHEAKRSRSEPGGRNLFGNLHVAGVRVAAPEGGMGLWFLFTDLCVRYEGSYHLRFRCYDLTAIGSEDDPRPELVACESQAFTVYSPRNFPGLPKPTDLSEHFARQGFKLNTRKTERTISNLPSPPTARPDLPTLPPYPAPSTSSSTTLVLSPGPSGTSGASATSGASTSSTEASNESWTIQGSGGMLPPRGHGFEGFWARKGQ
ncbi:hypothetical protein TREMEDRAFT_63857 [Tremella mesenterica DSM 1558]|uniref:uncharacterized protein n=1 Tax=Tremella mesenterica (strain ATCC 24925 / CBS 8224 / DSM 1558 / NBRC 9311 / NRRL Y-6157 / RJB 2259-6 / UBC 559-6) TaxID=578456 RepID=UPI0003F4917B|nr:uncharacterized protein TREMEDRAFT_63857 [Tremella mesenterica DSM 1558]EIW67972.1 hypothetical protein TREMEDRAFT_63857 [Tremella mesenterica DSM 1558]